MTHDPGPGSLKLSDRIPSGTRRFAIPSLTTCIASGRSAGFCTVRQLQRGGAALQQSGLRDTSVHSVHMGDAGSSKRLWVRHPPRAHVTCRDFFAVDGLSSCVTLRSVLCM